MHRKGFLVFLLASNHSLRSNLIHISLSGFPIMYIYPSGVELQNCALLLVQKSYNNKIDAVKAT